MCAKWANPCEIGVFSSTEQLKHFWIPVTHHYRARLPNLTTGLQMMETGSKGCFCPRKSVTGKQEEDRSRTEGRNRNETNICKRGDEIKSPWIATGLIEPLHWKWAELLFLTWEHAHIWNADSRLQRQTQKSCTDLKAEVLYTSTQRMMQVPIYTCVRTDGQTSVHIHDMHLYPVQREISQSRISVDNVYRGRRDNRPSSNTI